MDSINQRIKLEEYIYTLKPNLEKDDGNLLVDFAIQSVIDEVVVYCNFEDEEEIPDQLLPTMSMMAADFLEHGEVGEIDQEALETGSIKSIKEGDTTVSKETDSERIKALSQISMNLFLKNYARKLNRFRRLKR